MIKQLREVNEMSKTLRKLVEKAMIKGMANLNGRNNYGSGHYGELESKYQARYDRETDTFSLDHWGTNIITMEGFTSHNPKVVHIYVQSKSDRNAIMFVFGFCGHKDFYVSYKPSRDEFHCFVTFVGKEEPQEFII